MMKDATAPARAIALCHMQVWHERLLYPDQNAAKAREAAKSKGGISGRLRSLGLWS
jgi:hypothetical protein